MPKLPTGEMEVVIGLDQAKWDKFRQDKLWIRYATVDCTR